MTIDTTIQKKIVTVRFAYRLPLYLCVVLLIASLNANVDLYQHPEIPYFDEEHLLVGSIAGAVTIVVFFLLDLYFRSLEGALRKIRVLESFLSICANCKKIRIPGADPHKRESWKPIEMYIELHTQTRFSHGICPECIEKYFPKDSAEILNPECT